MPPEIPPHHKRTAKLPTEYEKAAKDTKWITEIRRQQADAAKQCSMLEEECEQMATGSGFVRYYTD